MPESLLHPGDDDFCPCGAAKKWKKCHGADENKIPSLADNPDVDPALLGLAYNVLDFLEDSIETLQIPEASDENAEEGFRKQTLLYFAKKVYRVTFAGVTLIRVGQSTQAFTLKRDQHYSWVSFHYYLMNEDDSVLFMASGPLKQRNNAQKIIDFNEEAAADPKRQQELKEKEEMAEMLYKRFPGLKVVKGKSGDR